MNINHIYQKNESPHSVTEILTIQESDVLFGRGNHTKNRRGNRYYRSLISAAKDSFTEGNYELKQRVSERIYECIQSLKPRGRFLHEIQPSYWTEIDKKDALKKIVQALRDKKCHDAAHPAPSIDHHEIDDEEKLCLLQSMLQKIQQDIAELEIQTANNVSPMRNTPVPVQPNDVDVIYGRGNHIKDHSGNVFYRTVVRALQKYYVNMHKKSIVSTMVYDAIRSRIPSGRFLTKRADGHYVEIDPDETIKKISQCFRENGTHSPVRSHRFMTDEEVAEKVNEMHSILVTMGCSIKYSSLPTQQISAMERPAQSVAMDLRPALEREDTLAFVSTYILGDELRNSGNNNDLMIDFSSDSSTASSMTSIDKTGNIQDDIWRLDSFDVDIILAEPTSAARFINSVDYNQTSSSNQDESRSGEFMREDLLEHETSRMSI